MKTFAQKTFFCLFSLSILSSCINTKEDKQADNTPTDATANAALPENYCNSSYVNNLPIYSPPPTDFPNQNNQTNHKQATVCGVWESVIPDSKGAATNNILGMQTVHSVLLPSGKILITSGSSWRNKLDVDYYPKSINPVPGTGLFDVTEQPFENSKLKDYYELVNNTAIYNPDNNSFYRIQHPLPEQNPLLPGHFSPNDQFCSGHLHLPDGNVLFAGGTEYYFPFRTGSRSSYIFDWRKELNVNWPDVDWRQLPTTESPNYLWTFSGFMKRGRWYPSLVPLNDGRIVLFSGFVDYGEPKVEPPMYQFEINSWVEFFDPYQFDKRQPQRAWKATNVSTMPNSPFNTRIYDSFEPSLCEDMEHFEALNISTDANAKNKVKPPCDCDARCRKANTYDAFKLYPNNYMVENNKIFLSREGDWVSLRTNDTAYMRRTKNSYWASIGGNAENPTIRFSQAAPRPEIITSYGSSYFDPNSNKVVILGGQPISAGTSTAFITSNDPHNPSFEFNGADSSAEKTIATHFLGGLGSAKMEQFDPNEGSLGQWTIDPDFLGEFAQDNRTMGAAIVLPTREILLVNGGNYDFYGPVLYPTLMTPQYDSRNRFTGYTTRKLTDAVEPRLYHNTAMLLPDGRIWVSGGNSARAAVGLSQSDDGQQPNHSGQVKPDLSVIDIDMYFFQDGQMAKNQKGMLKTPTENWTAEIFSPPYLFIGGSYRPQIQKLERLSRQPGITFDAQIGDKTYYLLQSGQHYQLQLTELPQDGTKAHELVLIKLPSFTHNWDQGHKFVSVPLDSSCNNQNRCTVRFSTPRDFQQANIPPGFYMMFYLDTNGKPSKATMVRLDDKAIAP